MHTKEQYQVFLRILFSWPDGRTQTHKIYGSDVGHILYLASTNWPGTTMLILDQQKT